MFLRIFKKQKPVPLGRWKVGEKQSIIDKKIDFANCDSCGVCDKKNLPIFYVVEGDVVQVREKKEKQ